MEEKNQSSDSNITDNDLSTKDFSLSSDRTFRTEDCINDFSDYNEQSPSEDSFYFPKFYVEDINYSDELISKFNINQNDFDYRLFNLMYVAMIENDHDPKFHDFMSAFCDMHSKAVNELHYFFQCCYFRNHLNSFKQNGQFNFPNPLERKCEAVGHIHDNQSVSVCCEEKDYDTSVSVCCEEKDYDTLTHDDSNESKTQTHDDENSENNGDSDEI